MTQTIPTEHEVTILATEYILYGDKTKAWRAAYPNSNAKPETQWTEASLVFDKPEVNQRISELRDILKKQSEVEFTLSVSELKQKLSTVIELGLSEERSNLGAVVSAIKEFNLMDGNNKPTETNLRLSGAMDVRAFNDFYDED